MKKLHMQRQHEAPNIFGGRHPIFGNPSTTATSIMLWVVFERKVFSSTGVPWLCTTSANFLNVKKITCEVFKDMERHDEFGASTA